MQKGNKMVELHENVKAFKAEYFSHYFDDYMGWVHKWNCENRLRGTIGDFIREEQRFWVFTMLGCGNEQWINAALNVMFDK